jgi:hypothetical protein
MGELINAPSLTEHGKIVSVEDGVFLCPVENPAELALFLGLSIGKINS